ncbi:NADAR family protein [Actinoplanes sp. NPDC020271]|uniref:NADAR family protein n=1 Tax=Actinoplanes sp. NPDC020271 TaxID=3363896 RepID=UPI0037AEAADE
MLSNFWPAEFNLGNRTYRTVEHAFQAAKIALVDARLAGQFALESGTELARGAGVAARKQRRLVLLDDVQLRRWDELKNQVMRDAMTAKFSRHEALRAVLVGTGPAQLWHGTGRGQPPARIHDLEAIRDVCQGVVARNPIASVPPQGMAISPTAHPERTPAAKPGEVRRTEK